RMRQLERPGRGALTAAEHASASDTSLSTDVHNYVDKAQLPSQTPQGGGRRVMGMSPSAPWPPPRARGSPLSRMLSSDVSPIGSTGNNVVMNAVPAHAVDVLVSAVGALPYRSRFS